MEDRTEPRASCTCSDDSINKWIGGAEGHPVWETLGGAAYEVPGLRAYHCLDCGGVAVVEDRRLPPNTMNCERCFQPLDAPGRPNYPCFSKHAPIPCSYCGTPLTREDFEGATVYDMATEQAAKLMRPCLACRRGERDSEPGSPSAAPPPAPTPGECRACGCEVSEGDLCPVCARMLS